MRKRSEVSGGGSSRADGVRCGECHHVFDPKLDECPRCGAAKAEVVCSQCGSPQKQAPGGPTCALGHNGVEGISLQAWEAKVSAAKARAKEPPAEPAPEPVKSSARVVQLYGDGVPMKGDTAPSEHEVVTYTFGEEHYSIKQFNHYKIGPFTTTTRVLPGETHADALNRLAKETAMFADSERLRKKAAHLEALKKLRLVEHETEEDE